MAKDRTEEEIEEARQYFEQLQSDEARAKAMEEFPERERARRKMERSRKNPKSRQDPLVKKAFENIKKPPAEPPPTTTTGKLKIPLPQGRYTDIYPIGTKLRGRKSNRLLTVQRAIEHESKVTEYLKTVDPFSVTQDDIKEAVYQYRTHIYNNLNVNNRPKDSKQVREAMDTVMESLALEARLDLTVGYEGKKARTIDVEPSLTQQMQTALENKNVELSPVDAELKRLEKLAPEPTFPERDLETGEVIEKNVEEELKRLDKQNEPVKQAESKLRTLLNEIKRTEKYGSKIIRAVPFVGAGLAAIEAFYSGEADARTTAQKTADAVNEGIKVLIAPDITQMGSGTLTERDPEALRRAMQPQE